MPPVPQLWALYKEVQDYYDKGMRVPDDITLLWCDDNWGNLRRLPPPEDRQRAGGSGIYYHLDYVGSPRNYKWVNSVSIPRIWEQMSLAHSEWRESNLDRERRSSGARADPDGIFPDAGVEPGSLAERKNVPVHAALGGPGIWGDLRRKSRAWLMHLYEV